MSERSILICDDEAELAEELGEFFEARGWRVAACASAVEAQRLLIGGYSPACLLTDRHMAGMEGPALAAYARSLPIGQRPRLIVMMTGQVVDRTALADTESDLFFFKPIDPQEIAEAIERELGPLQAVAAAQGAPRSAAEGLSVFVLDDDPDVREEIRETLESAGHRVRTAGDARQVAGGALHDVDLLILDLSLPAVDGFDVLQRLGDAQPAPRLVLISGHGEAVLRTAACAAEGAGLTVLGALAKPLDADALLGMLAALGARQAVVAEVRHDRATIAAALETGIAGGGLTVAFQPMIAVETLEFAGAEALLSGELPGLEKVTPPEIIAAAMAVPGLLVRLTQDVLRQASAACALWGRNGWQGTVSVNMPIDCLLQEQAVATLVGIVQEAGIPPESVVLELTEDSLYDTSVEALSMVAKLRLAGFGVALDDVGRRQSGLVQLANLPVTELKIDLEIVRQARSWTKARNIFGALADLGRRLDLIVVAEGVETPADFALAKDYGADYLQGYLISRKRPLQDLMQVLPELSASVRRLVQS